MARQQAAARKPSRSKRDKQQESDSGAGAATYEQELAEYLQERIKPGLNRGAIPLLARSLAKEIARRNQANGASEESDGDDEARAETDDELGDDARDESDDELEPEPDDDPEADADDEPEADADDEFDEEPEDEPEADADDEPEDEAEDEAEDEFDDEAEEEPEADDGPEDEAEDDDEEAADSDVSAFEDEMHELQADLGDEWILRFSVQGDEAWLTAEKQDGSQHLEAPTADLLREAVELLDEGGGRST